ncbi:hypothetical protein M199_gp035 [Halogranum tailed virus 1]|uniref:Uncharacterized protein n=1 Tax=Halogranum tailed virus 1 TaxID=1273749 RepID=R4T8Y9_9CAUD|nr:hypothetical protein M199_gp035 [Halogranum tailed virus 1]AGM11365.1 hypothetical protein HGTV1_35 [Halogranum tailed virus 1]
MSNDDTSQETSDNLEYIGSILASLILLGVMALIGAVALGVASLSGVPQAWFIAVVVPIVIMAAIQAFGKDVYAVFQKARK